MNTNQSQAEVAILISGKYNLKVKGPDRIKRDNIE